MSYERCRQPDCARPSEAVVVIVTVSLTEGNGVPVVQLALCADHAAWLARLALRASTRRADD